MPEAIAGSSFCLGLKMFAERVAHGRHQLIGKACRLARAKVGIECRRIELGGDGLLSFGRVNPAAALSLASLRQLRAKIDARETSSAPGQEREIAAARAEVMVPKL